MFKYLLLKYIFDLSDVDIVKCSKYDIIFRLDWYGNVRCINNFHSKFEKNFETNEWKVDNNMNNYIAKDT